jgi:hypothetical protein
VANSDVQTNLLYWGGLFFFGHALKFTIFLYFSVYAANCMCET